MEVAVLDTGGAGEGFAEGRNDRAPVGVVVDADPELAGLLPVSGGAVEVGVEVFQGDDEEAAGGGGYGGKEVGGAADYQRHEGAADVHPHQLAPLETGPADGRKGIGAGGRQDAAGLAAQGFDPGEPEPGGTGAGRAVGHQHLVRLIAGMGEGHPPLGALETLDDPFRPRPRRQIGQGGDVIDVDAAGRHPGNRGPGYHQGLEGDRMGEDRVLGDLGFHEEPS